MPALIARAEQDVVEARNALARHRAQVEEADQAAVEPQAMVVETVDADPVDEPARGRGRPRKVTEGSRS